MLMKNEYALKARLIMKFDNYKTRRLVVFYICFLGNIAFLGFNNVFVFFIES